MDFSTQGTFAENALSLRRAGWAVLPASGKEPLKQSFNRWKSAPGEKTVEQWAQRNPSSDIVFVAGLCKARKGPDKVIVVDPDDENAIGAAEDIFGDTPGKVRTRRGQHHYFDGTGIDLGTISSLRTYGVNIDLKHGQAGAAIIAAPPSIHEKDRSFRYSWLGCDPSVIGDLPPFPAENLNAFLEKHRPVPPKQENGFRCGSRGLWVNDQLVKHGPFFDGEGRDLLNSVLDKAHQLNDELERLGLEKLDHSEILRRSKQVMQDIESGKIERRLGRRATCTSDADEVRFFGSLPNGSDAFMLLQLFRGEHEARCRRGETFVIAIDAMVRDRVMGSWAARRYREARDLLLREGFIRQTCPARSTRAAEYLLEPRVLTPSLRACEKAALPMDVMRGGGRQKRSIVEHFAPAVPVPSVPAAPLMQAPFSETARISLNKTEPWLADGISRRTWFRKQKSAAARTDGRARS